MAKSNKTPVEPTVIVDEPIGSSETDAIETVVKGNLSEEETEEALKIHDEFLSRNYDGAEEPIPSELEVFVHSLRILAEASPLKSKINRLIDEIEAAFRF